MSPLAVAVIATLTQNPDCSFPGMVPQFWPVVIKPESSNDPHAIRDDSVKPARSYYPPTTDAAVQIARLLMSMGHNVGVGLSQLTANSEVGFKKKFGIGIEDGFDACKNMRAGAEWFVRGALSTYNSGTPTGAPAYAQRVIADLQKQPVSPAPNPPVEQDEAEAMAQPTGNNGEVFFNGE